MGALSHPQASEASRASPTFGPDTDVLAVLGLSVLGAPAPVPFGDDLWDFSALTEVPAYARVPRRLRVDWAPISSPVWRLCAKEVALGLLQPAVGLERRLPRARRQRLRPHDLGRHVYFWRMWFAWLADHDIDRLAQVTQAHCDAWLTHRRAALDATSVRAEIIAIRHFADYAGLLSADAFAPGFRPWGEASASVVAGCRPRGENTTPVIPDEVFGPLLGAALFLVHVAGPDVAAARAEWQGLQRRRPTGGDVDARLRGHLGTLRRAGRGLPELHPRHLDHQRARGRLDDTDPLHRVNLRLLERQIGVPAGALGASVVRRRVLEAALAELGCAPGGLTTAPTMVADPLDPARGRPWHPGFSPYELEDLVQLVVTAAYIVVAALSGLRHSELAEMRRGCVRTEELAAGKLRYRIEAKVIKGRTLGGAEERWTVVPDVADAFALVEGLVASELPFARINLAARYPALRRWVNGAGAAAFLTPIPDWHLNARQFRRTLARVLGFRPHGVLAGKIHLKHVSVVTSEGYYGRLGSSAAAFLAEVEAERARAQLDATRRLYDQWQAGGALAGPGRGELASVFAAIAHGMEAFEGSVVESERRLEQLLARRAATLHVGALNNCWFTDAARARCLQDAERPDAGAPLLGCCQPTRCANATIHPEHAVVWRTVEADVERLLASPRVPAQEKQRLGADHERIHQVLEPLAPPPSP